VAHGSKVHAKKRKKREKRISALSTFEIAKKAMNVIITFLKTIINCHKSVKN